MDYCFLGQDESKCLPILVIRDHASRTVFSHVVPCKGTKHQYPLNQSVADIEQLGHSKFILKSDQEPSILDLRADIISRCKDQGISIIPENSPTGESQSNGVIERAIQDVEGMVRTLKDQLECSYNLHLESSHPVLAWLVHHAGVLLSRFLIGVDGRTAYERLKGKSFKRKLVPFGECVHYQPLGNPSGHKTRLNKMEPMWQDGIFLGIRNHTGEYLIGTPRGVVRSYSMKRKPLSERVTLLSCLQSVEYLGSQIHFQIQW